MKELKKGDILYLLNLNDISYTIHKTIISDISIINDFDIIIIMTEENDIIYKIKTGKQDIKEIFKTVDTSILRKRQDGNLYYFSSINTIISTSKEKITEYTINLINQGIEVFNKKIDYLNQIKKKIDY